MYRNSSVVWTQVPELFEHQVIFGPTSILIMTNIGILLGVLVMFLLAIYENFIVIDAA